NDTDPESDPLTAVLVANPVNGTVALNANGSFTYTPSLNFTGVDTFTYKANDGKGDSNVATVTITVVPTYVVTFNPLPGAWVPGHEGLASQVVVHNQLATVPVVGVDFTAPAGYSFVTWTPPGFNLPITADGNYTAQYNAKPTAVDDAYTTNANTPKTVAAPGVLFNDTDPESDPLTAILVTNPANGTVMLNADGSFTYTPNLNFHGIDTFTYKANDGHGDSNVATVTITVINTTPPPLDEFAPIKGGVKEGINPLAAGENHGTSYYPPTYYLDLTGKDYYMGRYEVTKERWDVVRNWTVNDPYGKTLGYDLQVGLSKGPNHPVHSLNWYDCVKWCNARSEMEGRIPSYRIGDASGPVYRNGEVNNIYCDTAAISYRLPWEDEWEYAARGNAISTRYSWNNVAYNNQEIKHVNANYESNANYLYDTSATRNFHPTYAVGADPYTSPVGSFEKNSYELYDMAGNVYEWCFDLYSTLGTDRARRGGSWYYSAYHCRIGYRQSAGPDKRNYDYGFRLSFTSPVPLP
ncbi:MAG TPA: Ig-like domain-containing protein, partial [Lentisphaeria bacterium]|nr:Ig-like domain-containing protein [Lentisphaeria bacterium]